MKEASDLAEPINAQHLEPLLKPMLKFDLVQNILYVCDEAGLRSLHQLLQRKVLDDSANIIKKRIADVLAHLDTDVLADWGMYMKARRGNLS